MDNPSTPVKRSLGVLYEDDCYIVFDKPSGLLVIPTPKKEKNTMVTMANQMYAARENYTLHPCHRLDRDTSGAILFAKGKKYQQLMMKEFFRQSVKKKYTAFVDGHLRPAQGVLRRPLADFDERRYHQRASLKTAITRYRVVKFRPTYSVVEVMPLTGRTNQIRVHFSQIGHPLLGDRKYAEGKNFSVKFNRTALHASELEWPHPEYQRMVTVKAPLADDMRKLLGQN